MTYSPSPLRNVLGKAAVVTAVLSGLLSTGPAGLTSAGLAQLTPAAAYPSALVALVGHGFGHGRGMGQYGALGYAVDQGWSYHQILDHFYGGTVVGSVAPSTQMTVDMTAHDGQDTIVLQGHGALATSPPVNLGCTSGNPCAVRIERTGAGAFRVYHGTGCGGGPWVVAGTLSASSVTITATAGASGALQDMLELCELNDVRWLRGNLVAQDTGSSQVTVNSLPLDSYVRGVVPHESPAFWGTLGGGAGEQALDAQAVAARSYGMAENRWPWAKTCDTTSCQVYGGRAIQMNGGPVTDFEGTSLYATSDQAVSATAGEVRAFAPGGSGPAGSTARTEFSSSTGGYTAGGTFPAVPDAGDATSSNPNHDWTASIPVPDVEAAYASGAGHLVAVNVVATNGLGDLGGRVNSVQLSFQSASVTVTGNEFAATFGLKSNWFAVTNSAAQPYLALTANGAVYGFGGATVTGSPAAMNIHSNAVGLAEGIGGYWVLTSDGSVYGFGAVSSYGSLAGVRLNGPPHQIVATPSGKGYWIIASDGGVFSFGDAKFYGSTGGIRLNAPVVGVAATTDGGGYWLLGADGGVFSFGDAKFHGSTGGIRLAAPVNAMSATADGGGYWLAAADGGVFSFGSAPFEGSLPGIRVSATAVGMQANPSGRGYLIATSAGHVYGFGDAVASGGPADRGATANTVGVVYTR